MEIGKMKKNRIAIILHGLGPNGIDTLFANLSKYWDYEKLEITYFLAVEKESKQFWEDKVNENNVRVIKIHDLGRNKTLKWFFSLKKQIEKYGPFDVVHTNMDLLNGINLLVAKKMGIPKRICHAHRSSSEHSSSFFKKLYIYIMRKLIIKYSTDLLACSDVAGQYFYNNRPFKIVFNGIELDRYIQNNQKDKEEDSFLTVGRLTEQKNPFFLLRIFSEVLKFRENAILYWVGNGELLQAVKDYADTLNVSHRVVFLGIQKNVCSIMKKCKYFLLPSIFEGLSLSLAEAQAAGMVCFVSNTVSKLSDCGRCIYISLDDKEDKWANEICKIIECNVVLPINIQLLKQFDIVNLAETLEEIYL